MVFHSVDSDESTFLFPTKSPDVTVELFGVFKRKRRFAVVSSEDEVIKRSRITHGDALWRSPSNNASNYWRKVYIRAELIVPLRRRHLEDIATSLSGA